MHFDLLQTISLSGTVGAPNDDRIGCADQHAWVVDGATDLGEPGLVGARGGAAWLAAAADQGFAQASGDLATICGFVFELIAERYRMERRRDPVSAWELPRAAFAAVALEGESLACAFVGDCLVAHRSAQGVAYLTPEPNRTKEQSAAAKLDAGALGLRSPAVLEDRRASRERSQRCLTVDATLSRTSVKLVRTAVAPGDDLLLMSDGFAALIDAYGAYDLASLMTRVMSAGLDAAATELRRIELEDAACQRYPRFKASDDASAIWIRVA